MRRINKTEYRGRHLKERKRGLNLDLSGHPVASASGTVTNVTSERLQYRRDSDNRVTTLSLVRKGKIELQPLVTEGERVLENQILASVVHVTSDIPCPKSASEQDYIESLVSPSLSERYAAAKALSNFSSHESTEALARRISDDWQQNHVRLEAASKSSETRR